MATTGGGQTPERTNLHGHAAVYRKPDRRHGHIVVSEGDLDLLEPPPTEEGFVSSVEMEYAWGGRNSFVRCQFCGRLIKRTHPHVFAVVVGKPVDGRRFHNHKHVHYCDRDCWGAWDWRG